VNEKCSGKRKIKQVNIFLKRENIIFNEGIVYEFFLAANLLANLAYFKE
jgi:hypothetical protein